VVDLGRDSGQEHHRHHPVTVILWAVAAVLLLVGLIGLFTSLLGPVDAGQSRGAELVATAVLLIPGLILGFIAWRRQPLALGSAIDPAAAGTTVTSRVDWPGTHRSWGSRWRALGNDPRVHTLWLAVFLAAAVVATIIEYNGSYRSAHTQNSSIYILATVRSVDNVESCTRSSCDDHFYAAATLAHPVRGHSSTVIQGPGTFPFSRGAQTPVYVDPGDLSYAELPGKPLHDSSGVAGPAIVSLLLAIVLLVSLWRLLHRYPGVVPSRPRRGLSDTPLA
jgi:hypothetical protein